MFIGMMLGALAMIGNYTTYNLVACISPVLILGVPIFDTFFVIYIRYLRGMSIISGSPDHFALRLRKWKLSTKQTVVASYGISILLGCAALFIIQLAHLQALVVISILITMALLTGYLLKKIDMTL
jgi:UDP-GlcNAc:undecaprenyl-phosphate GlcNAc-1-phosphate transferase